MQDTQRGLIRALCAFGFVVMLVAWTGVAKADEARGAVTGSVTIRPGLDGRVVNTVVWVEGVPLKLIGQKSQPATKPQMVEKDLRFEPHVLPVMVGSRVDFPNQDKVFHNIYSDSPGEKFNLGLYPKGDSRSVTFDKPGIFEIGCYVVPKMKGYVVVVPEPYFTSVDARGLYKLTDLPLGTYKIKTWNPDFGLTSQEFTLGEAGQVLNIDFELGREE